jgi:lipopolysaccharide export LptBFGC system permease protein LptF
MKKILKIILLSSLLGTIFATIFFLSIKTKTEAKSTSLIYGLQVGAFKNEDNAHKLEENYTYSKVIKDNDYYRVFIGFTKDNLDILKDIYQDKNYYIKELNVSVEVEDNIIKYDELLKSSSEKMLVIKSTLEVMPDEL